MGKYVVTAVVLASAAIGVWYFLASEPTDVADAVAPEEAASQSDKARGGSAAESETTPEAKVDVTAQIGSWMACANRVYQSESDGDEFDEAAHIKSWDVCASEREAIVVLFPANEQPAWEDRLKGIHDSIRNSAIAKQTARPGYGLNPNNPVQVGGLSANSNEGPVRIYRYLTRLRGPDGELVQFDRIGSCCTFGTSNPVYGNQGRLDMYTVSFNGIDEPVTVYFNTYNEQPLDAVVGFKFTSNQ